MRYSKEFKLECVRKYKTREHIQDPGGCKHNTFYKKVNRWIKIYEQLGEEGLEHNKPKLELEDKLIAIRRIENGESINSVANSLGRQESSLSKWYKQYLQGGIDGLKSNSRKGNCMDNSIMENFFGIIKTEMFYGHEKEFKTLNDLQIAIEEYIKWYNTKRINLKRKGLSPIQYRQQSFI